MLSFFPTPYPDEILYSVLARYHVRSGNLSLKITLSELFGSTTVTATVDLPAHLKALARNLPPRSKYTVESILRQHTLYPLYAPFMPSSRAELIATSMMEHIWGDIHARAGIMASSVKTPSNLRFCPDCLREDQERYGEAYWHRLHQAPGVLVCPRHSILLQDSNVTIRSVSKHEFIPLSEANCLPKLRLSKLSGNTLKKLVILAQDVAWLLNNHIVPKGAAWFQQQYRLLLLNKGLATSMGRVNQVELVRSFKSFYGDSFLRLLDSTVNYELESNWLSSIVRKHRKSFHPIRHLLLIRYLSQSVTSFFDLQPKFKPFGDGPWRCFNGAVEHYLRPVITSVQISWSRDKKKPLGIFSCSCGFAYSTTDPRLPASEKFRFGKIKNFGNLWEQRLTELAEEQRLGLRETARQLRVDALTIKRHSERLRLVCRWRPSKLSAHKAQSTSSRKKQEKARDMHRKAWIRMRQVNAHLSKTDLRRQVPAVYTWLYRHDRAWLDSNSPPKVPPFPPVRRVNWEARDEAVLIQVQDAAKKILDAQPPLRATISKVGKAVGLLSLLERHIEKLPLTKSFLQTVVESQEQYQIRRVRWAATILNSRDEPLAEWKTIRLAGLKPKHAEVVAQAVAYEVSRNYGKARKMVG